MSERAPSRRATATSAFGVGKRENHDASDFYARFGAPVISNDADVHPPAPESIDRFYALDARRMAACLPRIEPNSVALVVTSPPYFAGKEYEEALGQGHIPGSYVEYLDMLHDVFAACVERLEPGGRIAVNVANLGRKPYRSLAADIVHILQDRLGLLLRGEIIWRKAEGSSGSCAWGSFQSASNPVLRDLTERVIVASKGRFDRALPKAVRATRGLPHVDTVPKDAFMSWTTDVWDMPTESATRVGHPAPYPVELPQRLIELYTYAGDVVLDPFMGSGTTAVAAVTTGRHFIGFDTDEAYLDVARERVDAARAALADADGALPVELRTAVQDGRMAKEVAELALTEAGFVDVTPLKRPVAGVDLAYTARDDDGALWHIELVGTISRGTDGAGLRRSDNLWRTLGKAAALRAALDEPARLLVLTTDLPQRSSPQARALVAARADGVVFDAVELLTTDGFDRLRTYAAGGADAPVGTLYPSRRS